MRVAEQTQHIDTASEAREPPPLHALHQDGVFPWPLLAQAVESAAAMRIGQYPTIFASTARQKDVVFARQACWLILANSVPEMKSTLLGARLKKDHTTALHGIRVGAQKLFHDARHAALFRAVLRDLERDGWILPDVVARIEAKNPGQKVRG